MSRKSLYLAVVFIATLCWSSAAFGQATGSFSGTVTDKSGSAVAGATVTVTSVSTGVARSVTTDDTGHYTLNLLPVSVYTVHVEFKGFQPAESKDVKLQVDEHRELDYSLSPSTVTSTVEVTAAEVAVETSNPSLGQVITSQQVAQLPLNGRDFVQLATLAPGTAAETNPNSFFTSAPSSEVAARGPFSLSVGGSRPNATDWLIDGVDNNELTAGGISILSNIDSIQEFKVLTYNYSAEYGTRAGPTVLLTTKSGTNAFHGSLYEFLRNTDLDARSFFALQREKFNQNQFGGSIGGPIRKNKTFFFVDGEQKYLRKGVTFTGLVPSLAMRNGDFSTDPFGQPANATLPNPNMVGAVGSAALFQCDALGNPLPVNADGSQAVGTACAKIPGAMAGNDPSHPNGLIDPIGQAMMNLYPAPNTNDLSHFINYVNSPVRKLDETKFDIRVDHNFSASDTVFARFSYDQANSYVPGGAPGFAEQSAFGSNQGIINHARNVAIGETHIFSPITVNQFSFGYNRIFDYITSQGTGTCASAQLGIVGANLGCDTVGPDAKCTPGAYSCGLTSLLFVNGYWSIGDRGYSPFQGGTNIFTVNDTLNFIRGKHDIKVGIGIRANQMNVGTEAFQDGFWIPLGLFYTGNAQADFLLGLTNVALHDQTFNGTVTGRRWKVYRPFVQDDWRVNSRLTLNLGLAWDIQNPVTEVNGKLANYDPYTDTQYIAGVNGASWSAGVKKNWTLFEPRIGFAYKLTSSGNTVLRAGYAIFHDSAWSQGAQGLWQNPPFFAESNRFGFGCPFTWSWCHTTGGQDATGVSIDSFPIISNPPTNIADFAGTLFYQPPNFHPGTVQQYNANVERELPGNVVLTVGYAGAKGYDILVSGNNLNTNSLGLSCAVGVIGCNPDGTAYTPPFANPKLGNAVLAFGDYGKTSYNSLQVKAETKTPKYGLYALIAYTYSHTYDNGLTDGLGSLLSAPYFPLPNWTKYDWAPSQIDAHNNFSASVIYDLPFGKGKKWGNNWDGAKNSLLGGWQLTVIQRITSGFATPLLDSNNASGVTFNNGGNGNNYNRPDVVAGCNIYGNRTRFQSFNPNCFSHADGHLGDASRVPVYGPDFVNTDFSVIKQFALPWESTGITFRAEVFNLWNHAQFGLPVNDVSAAGGFGSVQSTVNNPRLVQFGLKFTF